jgi:hypothetical protein
MKDLKLKYRHTSHLLEDAYTLSKKNSELDFGSSLRRILHLHALGHGGDVSYYVTVL